jgi:hypothetical protein
VIFFPQEGRNETRKRPIGLSSGAMIVLLDFLPMARYFRKNQMMKFQAKILSIGSSDFPQNML